MNTEFLFADRQFTLIRYPEKHQHVSLQAWDSADELLIEHIETSLSEGAITTSTAPKMMIFNDDFGVLGCWFAHVEPLWVSDSYIAYRSLLENLTANQLTPSIKDTAITAPVQTLTSVDSLSFTPASDVDIVVIKIPRALALLEQQLIDIQRYITPDTHVVAAGKVKTITKSVLGLFEKYIGKTTTSLAKKKSRLVFATRDNTKTHAKSPYPTRWQAKGTAGQTLTLDNLANVFSRQSLDIGARIMLEHMTVSANDVIVDLGCGNGVLGVNALALAPDAKVIFVDESYMALESARLNVLNNFPDKIDQCEFVASNCLEALLERSQRPTVTKILCNPPFHQQNAITDHIAWQMFTDSRDLLVKSGHLVVVGNRHLDYHIKLKKLFGGAKVLASDKKFVILGTAKR
ncbi:ribosomal RNA large subunit methyltransferase G [Alteromonas sp. KC3]|uniref:methyltransferase n=1 Tax=unclassified Alteromonas TaxID=2614992 RepID=UPI0019236E60|nr:MULTISPECIES: methyltransferase [unclassified Alteromonas]BCO17723.1 ribosomal RNA large subunit methyltransferase G [Alteromonas sp. KC3]BCO21684.1 ribosomal RNA large subunit methyltransferase G [Alteromonas sp. KC14]